MKITFLDCTNTHYDGLSLSSEPLGGIEGTTIALAEALSIKGHDVSVINQNTNTQPKIINGVHWNNYKIFDFNAQENYPDVLIVNNDAPLFNFFPNLKKYNKTQCVLWLHNPVKLFKTLKKRKMLPIIKYRPTAVFLGEKHKESCSFMHPFERRMIIPHGLTNAFLSDSPNKHESREKQVIFFSQPYRGFKEVVDIWMKFISKSDDKFKLKAYVGEIDLKEYNISYSHEELQENGLVLMPKVEKSTLITDLKNSRCMIYFGHRDETFCVAALEANAMGVPIITYGRGALSERVDDSFNGFQIDDGNQQEVAVKAYDLLNDDHLFHKMSQQSIEHVQSMTWDHIADQWELNVFRNF